MPQFSVRIGLVAALCLHAAGASAASRPASAPGVKPPPFIHSRAASQNDLAALKTALEAVDAHDWITVRTAHSQIHDHLVSKIVSWHIATNAKSRASFDELASLLSELENWPKMHGVRSRAESLIGDSSLSHTERVNWFETHHPVSGVGKVRLAQSLRALGRTAKAKNIMRDLWHADHLPYGEARKIMRSRAWSLSAKDHWIRGDMLLWSNKRRQARMLLPHMVSADRRLIAARIALMERRRGVDWAVRSVPASRTRDPGLLYDRARWRRKKGRPEQAIPLLLLIRAEQAPASARPRIWRERNLALRKMLKRGEYAAAYRLAADHGMTRGTGFADAEWLAGWLALRYLNDAAAAAGHFSTMRASVSTPISQARASYWLGRAMTEMNRSSEAFEAYRQASMHPHTYYGQLASEDAARLSGALGNDMALARIPPASAAEIESFENRDLVRVAIILADLGRMRSFKTFIYHIDDHLGSASEHDMVYQLASSYLQRRVALRSAKTGMSRGLIASEAAYPIPGLHEKTGKKGVIETALLLAVSRQESEFDPKATSHAGARGLMQLMPATARRTARKLGLGYQRNWLRDDPLYNLRLGQAHLTELLEEFDGSYVMALAAYNAGAGRVRKWTRAYGDPRSSETDPIDWVENIPFSETRNYVQRVLESVQVYRYRLDTRPVPISLWRDLTRGRPSKT